MPTIYSEVLDVISNQRRELETKQAANQVSQTFVHVDQVYELLKAKLPNLSRQGCVAILRTLHDLGDILWFENLNIKGLKDVVILHPLLLIEFFRQGIHHNHNNELLSHTTLKGLPYWINLEPNQMLMMNQLLQHFQLVYPADDSIDDSGGMQSDSDLIVPAYWRANESALWLFCNDILRLDPDAIVSSPPEPIRVRWEYHFTTALPELIMDQLVVASYHPQHRLRSALIGSCINTINSMHVV